MPRKGPPPLPTALKQQRGTNRKHRENPDEPKPPIESPDMPLSVRKSKFAKEAWDSLSKRLVEMKVLSKPDAIALEGLCLAYAQARKAEEAVEKHGLVVRNTWGALVANPAVKMSRAAWSEVRKFAQEFGLTPSSRSRVHASGNPSGADGEGGGDNAEDFFFGKQARGRVVGKIG